MENTAPEKKKFPWKITLIILLVIGVTITTVVLVRKHKRKAMIEGLKMNGTSITDDVLNNMSYADIKELYTATTGTTNP